MIVQIRNDDGQVIGGLMPGPKTFSTGSRGFYASGKVEIDGKKYQLAFQAVEIHSKPEAKE